jgi:V-type H+-transporting ATPase proteolipid subunit
MSAANIAISGIEHAPFFAYMGIAAAIIFANLGSAYGTAKTGVGICSMGVLRPELIFKSVIPVVMAGILGIYGLIVGVILNQKIEANINFLNAYKLLGAGLCCGLSSLAAGLAIGIVGDAGVRANAQQEKVFIGMILILIFAEAVALYGFIISLMVATSNVSESK